MVMCGRFNVDFETEKELNKILKELNKKYPGMSPKAGEVFPTDTAAILVDGKEEAQAELSVWGFPQYAKKGVIINARSETALEKPTFRDSILTRRCLIPTSGFYEWDKEKNKYLFEMEHSPVLYLAGIYKLYQGISRFVILTTAANASMAGIHHRMPVVVEAEQMQPWLTGTMEISRFLSEIPPMLERRRVEK